MKNILITGATSGIGEATTRKLAEEGNNLILCGRNSNKLDDLANEFAYLSKIKTLSFDVRNRADTYENINSALNSFQEIDVLINNAGNAHGLESIYEGNEEDWDKMMDINVKGLLNVSKAVIPSMVKNQAGHIINVGSLAGYEVYANGTAYCASKYAVKAINEGLRKELNGFNIKVSSINPGLVETNFSNVRFKGDTEKAKAVYKGYTPLKPQDIANTISFMINQPEHVNLAEVMILPTAQASSTQVKKEL